MRGLSTHLAVALALVAACSLACGCDGGDDRDGDALVLGREYVDDAAYRERVMAESLVVDDNGYARLRLESYGGAWAALPIHDPPVRPLTEADIGRFVDAPSRPSTADEPALAPVLGDGLEWTEEALLALGRRAFEEYPAELVPEIGRATSTREELDRFGLWMDDRGRVGGLVRVATADGAEHFAITCATCHAALDDDSSELVHGVSNVRFDWGAILYRDGLALGLPPEHVESLGEWGAGRVDVTPDGADNPVAIPDLRPVRHHAYLHYAGTVRNDLIALAVRIETLLITSAHEAVRPPRELAFALALYVFRMGERGAAADGDREPRGAVLFEERCAGCHGADGSTAADRVAIDRIGTDAAAGLSTDRGTGYYRVPSLWRVGERTRLLHDGRVSTLESLLDAARLSTVPGHAFGLDLTVDERAALSRFTRTIGAPVP